MAYALSFAEDFFWGDPNVPPETLQPSDRPACVYQALVNLSTHEWAELARDVFGVEPDHLEISTVIARIQETNTCGNLDSPVEVFVDRDGWYRLLVFDRKEDPRVPRPNTPAASPAAEQASLHDR
jgi:hypothetical protein